MNATIHLLDRASRAVVGVHSSVPADHASTVVGLGTDRRASGTLVAPDGLILTVNYALMGAQAVIVTLAGGEQLPAAVVAQDYGSGLGLIRIDVEDCPFLKTASS